MNVTIPSSLASTVHLNDGVVMPLFGLGTSGCSSGVGGEAENAVLLAIKHGYRLIDTATRYGNEADVGRAVGSCGLARDQLFIVTKVWNDCHGYNNATKALGESLQRLQMDYVDLYLIHSPIGGHLVDTYKALLEAKARGKVRSVGVSNFGIQHLEGLKAAGLPAPSVNQIELHVWQHKKELVDYCRANNIAVMGYRALTKSRRTEDKIIYKMAKKHGKSYAQILLRWSVQMGFINIPKSSNEAHMLENTQVFDWTLDQEDLSVINGLEEWSCAWKPMDEPWVG